MDKKWFSYFAVTVVLFVGFFVVGKKTKSYNEKETSAEVSQAQLRPQSEAAKAVPSNAPNLLLKVSQLKKAPVLAQKKFEPNLKSGELYRSLFDGHAFANLNQEDLQKISQYFAKPYPQNLAYYQAQMVDRLGVLKALEQQAPLKRGPSSAVSPELISFYKSVLENKHENWLVKRQVFKNLKASLSSTEREAYYSRLDSRIVSLASSSEAEILEGVVNEKRPL